MARSPFSKSITDNADATDLFFHGFLLCCWISLRLSGAMIVTDYLLLEESCAVQAQIQSERNPLQYTRPNKEIREKIKSVASVLSVNSLSACGLSRRRRSTTMWYCLPDNSLLLSYNPETSSRVTLALLGIVFQTKSPDTITHLQDHP